MTVPAAGAGPLWLQWQRFVALVAHRMRLRNPWNYKAPLLIAFTYLTMALGGVAWQQALAGVLASLMTIAGIAGVAYFLNDLTDIRQDLAAGKPNGVAAMSVPQRVLTLLAFLAVALLPWWWVLPFTALSGWLLAAEFALFVLYSVPPFRLKERGLLGVVTDASYAHALPAVLAMLTFAAMARQPDPHGLALLWATGAWQLCLGMRNIVLHQLLDHLNDRLGGNRTWAVDIGPERLSRILGGVLVPLEGASFVVFAAVLWPQMPWLLPAYAAYAVLATWRLRWLRQPRPRSLRETLFVYADNFYADWLPLFILALLLVKVPGCWPLAVLHVLVLRSGLRQTWQDLRGRRAARAA